MRLFVVTLVGCIGLPALWADPVQRTRPEGPPRYHPTRVLVKPKTGRELGSLSIPSTDRVLSQAPDSEIQVIELNAPGRVEEVIAEYERSGEVEWAEPDYVLYASKRPNDPRYLDGGIWALHNTGQRGGLAGADLGAEAGWNVQSAASDVVVAVIDSGIRYTHEDLAENMWVNAAEISDNGVDDDRNGVIDDVHGYNAYARTGDPADDNGHGTHVAGIIGAVGDNRRGSVGVAWKVQLMACKFMDEYGEGATSDAIRCIDYARRNGAHIINASWGGGGFSTALQSAIRRARDAGIIFVTAAGNDGHDLDRQRAYPASYTLANVVTVAATTREDLLADYSNVGARSVLLAAPGSEIFSTWNGSDRSYSIETGTSMAAPYVTGALALVKAVFPNESYSQLIARLKAAADPLPGLTGYCVTGGRLNLRQALGAPLPLPSATAPARLSVGSDPATGSTQFRLAGEAGAQYVIEGSRDLRNWVSLFTKQAAADGTLSFSDPGEMNAAQRYYRARLVAVQ